MKRKGIVITIVVVATLLFIAANPVLREKFADFQHERELARGKELAASYCAACHLEPMPAMLPRKSWEMVLGYMGYMLGIWTITRNSQGKT